MLLQCERNWHVCTNWSAFSHTSMCKVQNDLYLSSCCVELICFCHFICKLTKNSYASVMSRASNGICIIMVHWSCTQLSKHTGGFIYYSALKVKPYSLIKCWFLKFSSAINMIRCELEFCSLDMLVIQHKRVMRVRGSSCLQQ